METNSKIYIAGINGMVGSAFHRWLKAEGYVHIMGGGSKELDLRDQKKVRNFFEKEKPDYVFLAAAKVGGIHANNEQKAEFLYDNLMIQSNVIHTSFQSGVKKLLFMGSSCVYPKNCPQPIREEYLLTGELEPTNEPYAVAKIAGIKMCDAYRSQYGCNFISVMPTNLYGPNDHYDLQSSHVLPALMKKIHQAKQEKKMEVEIWGTGKPLREFLHVDDLAKACIVLMKNYNGIGPVNVGSGEELSIFQLAEMIGKVIGYSGNFSFNTSKPDGTPRKFLDSSKIQALGWKSTISLEAGIREVYQKYF